VTGVQTCALPILSRSGVIPISYSQDSPGPISRTVEDAAILLSVLTGVDNTDKKSLESKVHFHKDYTQFLKKDGLKGKRIGFYAAPSKDNKEVTALMEKTVAFIKSQGAEVIMVDEILKPKIGNYSMNVMIYEFNQGVNDYLKTLSPKVKVKTISDIIAFNKKDPVELKYFGQEFLKMKPVNKSEYEDSLKRMLKGSREDGVDRVLKKYKLDAIMAPTGGPAWKTDLKNGDTFDIGSASPAAIAGYPNITVPMGFVGELPVGISFFSTAWSEPVLLQIAYAYEQGTKHRRMPKFLK